MIGIDDWRHGARAGGPVSDPWWSRTWFLNTLSALTFLALIAFHVWWWQGHGRPLLWVLLLGTPILAFVPSGVIIKCARRRWVREWASANGFHHLPESGWPLPPWDFTPFSVGRARRKRVRDAMTGRIGEYPATYFHYTWLNNNRVNLTTHYRNVFTLGLPAALPRLTMGVTIDTTTGERVLFESADFNERFSVYSTNSAFAHAVFTPRTIERLTELGRTSGAVIMTKFEIVGDSLVAVTTLGNRPHQISEVFAAMALIADGIPRFIWTDFGVSASPGERSVS